VDGLADLAVEDLDRVEGGQHGARVTPGDLHFPHDFALDHAGTQRRDGKIQEQRQDRGHLEQDHDPKEDGWTDNVDVPFVNGFLRVRFLQQANVTEHLVRDGPDKHSFHHR
jgi:hypothetical protein